MKWELKYISEYCIFDRGLTYKKNDEVDFSKNAVLRSNNVDLTNNKLNLEDIKYIDERIAIAESKKIKKGSLLICMANGSKAHLGKVALIEEELNFAFGGFMGLITPKKDLDSKFLYYNLVSERYRTFINSLSDGANINNLKFSQFNDFVIPIPPLEEQQTIVAKLDQAFTAIDQAKANIEKNIANAKELFQSKLNQIFYQKGEEWKKLKIENVCKQIFAGGDAPKENFSENESEIYNIPIYANAFAKNGLYGFTNFARVNEPALTIAARGSGTGFSCIRYEPFFPIVRLLVLIPNELINLRFLKLAIDNQVVKSSGSAIPQLTVPMLKSYSILYPKSLETQQQIVNQLDHLQEQTNLLVTKYQQKLANLEELKKSILEKAFKGKLV